MTTTKPKIVYIPMSADLIHPGHINIIQAGAKLGFVVIGLLTDDAIMRKKGHLPIMSFANRKVVLENINGVGRVVAKTSIDYRPDLLSLRPAYVVHGDDWSEGARRQVVDTLTQWGGELIELPYTKGISSTLLRQRATNQTGSST